MNTSATSTTSTTPSTTSASPTSTRPKRQPSESQPSESYAQSAGILLVAFLVHYFVLVSFENSSLLRPTAELVSKFVWATSNWFPVVPVVIYFVVVMWHLYVRTPESKEVASKKGGPGTLTNKLLILWNLGLASFSMLMVAGLGRGIKDLYGKVGWFGWVCDGVAAWESLPGLTLHSHLFLLSKFPELVDTAFLVIRGKPVMFLHWYHHISVLLYCWYVAQIRYPATFFAVVNAFVHSVMYYYYFRTAMGVRPQFDKMVTTIQLVQMAAGLLNTLVFVAVHLTNPKCDGGAHVNERGLLWTSYGATGAMYLSYFILFALFYINRYNKKGESHKE